MTGRQIVVGSFHQGQFPGGASTGLCVPCIRRFSDYDAVCGDITKATKATKDADGFAQTAVDAQKLAGQKFGGAKALLTDYTTLSADKCL
jgi:hypothetical protein